MTYLHIGCLALAIIPAILFAINLVAYRRLPAADGTVPSVSVLIPARDEEASIGDAVESALADRACVAEVLVYDDGSEDATAEVVRAIALRDARVRLISGEGPPAGWCGKQYACWMLAHEATGELIVFIDADVRLAPAAPARIGRFMVESGADLASGVPRQVTVGLMERLLIPLIHFMMLGFMPIPSMRRTSIPSLSAGCGQLFAARREAYFRAGGHAAIRSSLHDGIKLPRAFRASGLHYDLFDATDAATCRMYRTADEVWKGLAKNADEALAAPSMIVPMTIILLGGQVAPFGMIPLIIASWPTPWSGLDAGLAIASASLGWLTRLAAAGRFRQSILGAALHPLGVALLVAIQWYAFVLNALGRPSRWKGRPYGANRGSVLESP